MSPKSPAVVPILISFLSASTLTALALEAAEAAAGAAFSPPQAAKPKVIKAADKVQVVFKLNIDIS